jgi:hypothetical protein
MTWLPIGSSVVYPDGVKRGRPRDGERFAYNGEIYTWDNQIERWSNWRGKIVEFKEKEDPVLSMYDNWTHAECQPPLTNYEDEAKKKTEGEKLRDFFFPKNELGCECGVWLTGSDRHSKHCKLYREEK